MHPPPSGEPQRIVSRAIAQFLETGSGSGPKIESELPDAIRLPAGLADGPDGGYGNTTEWGNGVRFEWRSLMQRAHTTHLCQPRIG